MMDASTRKITLMIKPLLVSYLLTYGIDMALEAFIAISVRPSNTAELKKVFPTNEKVKEVFYVTGEFDFLLRAEAANTFELARIIEDLRSQEGVENTVTFIVLEKLK